MAKQVNKAYLKYKLNKEDTEYTEIRFHSVISEDHGVDSEITKFPVQSGYDVSNHAIKKNRKVVLEAMISDTQMLLSEEFHEYSTTSNSRAVYEELKRIVREAVPCTVVTNLTTYDPVLFTSFKTKQMAGMTDAMKVLLVGEEVMLATTTNAQSPTTLIFKPVPDEERAAKIEELQNAGYDIHAYASISIADCDLNEGYALNTTGANGASSKVTYEKTGFDPTTAEYSYECSISPDGSVSDTETGLVLEEPDAVARLQNGANVFGNCLVEQTIDLATEEADNYITTAMGDLKKSVYGGLYEFLGVNGNRDFGQKLLGLGLDCFICGATATGLDEDGRPVIKPDEFDTDLPTSDDILEGAAKRGDSIATDTIGQASPTTITKISGSSVGSTSFFGDLL